MPRLLVTPLSTLRHAIALHQPSHLVSLLSPSHMIPTPEGFPAARHLKLGINDVADAALGENPPSPAHVEALLDFARGWDAEAPLLVHCWAGISRSMAACFTILCDRLGEGREAEIGRALRRRAPHAAPNRLFVAHADVALHRKGRMIAAITAMGPAAMVEEGVLTELPLTGL